MSKFGSSIPTWLLIPGPADSISQPVNPPRTQELPIGELSFENLQRLCVRLLLVTKGPIQCQEYGTPGQKQEGIDLYARFSGDPKIEVWQCKRHEKFEAGDIREAVAVFLNGALITETKTFVLVTSANTEKRNLADADIVAGNKLRPHKIDFVLMGCTQLTTQLKDHPEIIDDFFGRHWVTVCCGEEKAAQLGGRLSAEDVPKYRSQLRKLYASVFEQADSLLARSANSAGNHHVALPLPQRWVMPTLSCKVDLLSVPHKELSTESGNQSDPQDEEDHRTSAPTRQSSLPMKSELEMSAEVFIGSTERGVILGDPGHGKSAMLRVVALDLLAENPCMKVIADRFGNRLPVWLPFAFVSAKVAAGESLENAATAWIRKNGGDVELEQLVRRAINDDRLLLLIDGLDEWSDQDRARETVVAIQGFLSQHPAGCFVTARPLGYARLDRLSGDWKHGTLRALSPEQQSALASLIFKSLRYSMPAQVQQIETEKFIRKLQQEQALGAMAATPLLLVGLVSLWIQNQTLPSSRLAVCEALVKEMTEDHPSRRASVSASIPTLSSISSQIRRGALASLAWSIHTSTDSAFLGRSAAEKCFCSYFTDTEGMPLTEAKAYARDMLPISDQIIGVLAEASSGGDVQFVHRTFQEFLAAEHLSSFSIEEQVKQCEDHASDPVWHQVLLFLIQKSNRPGETDRMIQALEMARPRKRDEFRAKLLLAEVLFSQVRMSASYRTERAKSILDEIELGTWMPWRVALLNKVLAAPPGTNVYSLLVERLRIWTPKPGAFFVYDALAAWPEDSEAEEALWNLLNHEDVYRQIGSAKALALRCKGAEVWKKRLLARLDEPLGCDALGACMLALAEGWFHDVEVIEVFKKGRDSVSQEIVLPCILGLIHARHHDQQCKEQLLRHGDSIYFRDVAEQAALKGWPHDNEIKGAVLRCISNRYSMNVRPFSRNSAWRIAIEGYPGDDDVANAISAALTQEYPNFGYSLAPNALLSGFAGHPLVVAASGTKLEKMESGNLAFNAQFVALAKTEASKMALMERALQKSDAEAILCLQVVWGNEDPEVQRIICLQQQEDSPIETYVLFHDTRTMGKDQTRRKLIQSLDPADCSGLNVRIIEALRFLRTAEPDHEVVQAYLRCFEGDSERLHGWFGWHVLLNGFSDHPKVRELADIWTNSGECNWGLISKVYSNNSAIRSQVKKMCYVLPEPLRFEIALECRQRAAYEPEFRSIAEGFRREDGPDVRMVGAISVAEAMIARNENTIELANYFAKETVAVGPQHEARVQAGIAGLIALDEISKLLEQRQFNDQPPSIPFLFSHTGRNILHRHIVRNWSRMKGGLGDELWGRFQHDSNIDLLREIALDLGKADVAAEVDYVLRERLASPEINLISLASQNAPGWVEICFGLLGSNSHSNSINSLDAHTASRMLAKYGVGNNAIKERLEKAVKEEYIFSAGALETLARGWPESECLRSAWAERKLVTSQEINIHDAMLIATCASCEEFVPWLQRWLQRHASCATSWDLSEYRWFVMRRCFRDTEVASCLLTILKTSESANEWVSFPWLIRGSGLEMADHQLREWAEHRWSTTAQHDWSVFGFDLFKSEYVPLKESLLELLLTDRAYSLN